MFVLGECRGGGERLNSQNVAIGRYRIAAFMVTFQKQQ